MEQKIIDVKLEGNVIHTVVVQKPNRNLSVVEIDGDYIPGKCWISDITGIRLTVEKKARREYGEEVQVEYRV